MWRWPADLLGGVVGAGGSFLGFLRLGLWDSWGQFLFDGSRQRVNEAGDGFVQLYESVDQRGFFGAIGHSASEGYDRFVQNLEDEHIHAAAESFGSTAMDVYFAGRSIYSIGRGAAGLSRAAALLRLEGNPAPWRSAMSIGLREAMAFRGVGLYPGPGVLGTMYGLPVSAGGVPRVRIIRFLGSQNSLDVDLTSKAAREPGSVINTPEEQPRTLADMLQEHRQSSTGSPMQSAYPFGNAETMLVANPCRSEIEMS